MSKPLIISYAHGALGTSAWSEHHGDKKQVDDLLEKLDELPFENGPMPHQVQVITVIETEDETWTIGEYQGTKYVQVTDYEGNQEHSYYRPNFNGPTEHLYNSLDLSEI